MSDLPAFIDWVYLPSKGSFHNQMAQALAWSKSMSTYEHWNQGRDTTLPYAFWLGADGGHVVDTVGRFW